MLTFIGITHGSRFIVSIGLLLLLAACDKPSPPTTVQSSTEAPGGEIYRSLDDAVVLRIISQNECELKIADDTILLCKYTRQSDAIRVLVTRLGQTEVEYLRLVNEGLQTQNGGILLSSAKYNLAIEQIRQKRERMQYEWQQREAKRLALLEESKKETQAVLTFALYPSSDSGIPPGPKFGDAIVTNCSVTFDGFDQSNRKVRSKVWFGEFNATPSWFGNYIEFRTGNNPHLFDGSRSIVQLGCKSREEAISIEARFKKVVEAWNSQYEKALVPEPQINQ